MRRRGYSLGLLFGVLMASTGSVAWSREVTAPPDEDSYCTESYNREPRDYRLRNSSEQMRWAFDDNWRAHTARGFAKMQAGEYSERTKADFNWTLLRWPNHIDALKGIVQYDLAGGRIYSMMPTHCYFRNARRFAPDDVSVILVEGYWRWKKKDFDRAVEAYEDVLTIDPDSVDAHYNLGLVYFDLGNFPKAREHASLAYSGGYPLPGLREKLKKAGQWVTESAPTVQ